MIGLISDTHGLVRPAVFDALEGVELILHAGDLGSGVLDELRAIAPVQAVRGNTDPAGDPQLPEFIELQHDGVGIHVSHGHELGAPTPEKLLAKYAAGVIVYGHTHRQVVVRSGDRWVVNPGSAGPRRFNLLPTVARMTIRRGEVDIELVELE